MGNLNSLSDPRSQAMLGMGAGMLSQPYTAAPQSGFEPFGRGIASGMNAFQNALILQQQQAEVEAKKQEIERKAKEAEAQKKAVSDYIAALDGPPELKAALALQAGVDIKGAAETAVERATPPEPTTKERNIISAQKRLQESGVWDQFDEAQQRQFLATGTLPVPEEPGFFASFNAETGQFEIGQGQAGMKGKDAADKVESLNRDIGFQNQIGRLIYDPIMERAVGPQSLTGRATGADYLKNAPEYQFREQLKQTIEPRVLELGGRVLKGSQTEKEWEMVKRTMPTVDDSPEVWRNWYQNFLDVELKIMYGASTDEYKMAKRQAASMMRSQPMSHESAIRWLEEGDEYIGPDGKKYRLERE